MQNVMTRFWNDDEGALITVEWLFVVTIMVIGLVVGLKTLQGSVLNELEEVAAAIGSLSQSYRIACNDLCPSVDPITGVVSSCASNSGSSFTDQINAWQVDTCVDRVDTTGVLCPD
jgi:Flp pilus assembly pilin Flp